MTDPDTGRRSTEEPATARPDDVASWTGGWRVASSLLRAAALLWAVAVGLVARGRTAGARLLAGTRSFALAGRRAADRIGGPLQRALLGRSGAISALLVVLTPVLAALGAWAVATTGGYELLLDRALGTWTGRDPALYVAVAAALLVAAAAASAAVNSGLLPTALVAAAPVFGAAATRYGNRVVDPVLGPSVVSLPEAAAFAGGAALAVGVPVGVAGFCLGVAARRLVRAVSPGGSARSDPDGA